MSYKIQRHAVRGVYRCIVRHLTHVDPSLIKQVRRQFKRRKEYAKIGHVRAAYELEEELRAVALGQKQISDVISKFKQKKLSPGIEKNAMSRHRIWESMDERRVDRLNRAPQPGTLKYAQVHMAAGLNNLRYKYIQRIGIEKDNCDYTVVDTVLAPAYKWARTAKRREDKKKREQTPRQARVVATKRDGVKVHTIRIQGYRANTRGFGRLFKSLLRNRRLLEKINDLHVSMSKSNSKQEQQATKRLINEARRKLNYQDYFKIQRLILLKRRDRIQTQLNYEFRLKKQNKLPKRNSRGRLRLVT